MENNKIEQYPLKQRKSLMDLCKNQSKNMEISFNQWLRNAMKAYHKKNK